MNSEQEARAYQLGAVDGIDAANTDAPSPESNAGTVLGRAWTAAADQVALHSQVEREEYFLGWTHGYVVRAEGIEDAEHEREANLRCDTYPDDDLAQGDTKTSFPQPGSPSNSPLIAEESSPLMGRERGGTPENQSATGREGLGSCQREEPITGLLPHGAHQTHGVFLVSKANAALRAAERKGARARPDSTHVRHPDSRRRFL